MGAASLTSRVIRLCCESHSPFSTNWLEFVKRSIAAHWRSLGQSRTVTLDLEGSPWDA